MSRVVLLLMALLSSPAFAWAPVAFQGLQLGASEDELRRMFPLVSCHTRIKARTESERRDRRLCVLGWDAQSRRLATESGSIREFRHSVSIAGVGVSYVFFSLRDGKVTRISLHPHSSSFDRVSAALLDRYGKPTSEDIEAVRIRSGGIYENRKLRWIFPDGQIVLHRYGGSADHSSLVYLSNDATVASKNETAKNRDEAPVSK